MRDAMLRTPTMTVDALSYLDQRPGEHSTQQFTLAPYKINTSDGEQVRLAARLPVRLRAYRAVGTLTRGRILRRSSTLWCRN